MEPADLIDRYRLPTTFRKEAIEHRRLVSDRARGLRRVTEIKKWSRVRELGHGGFGTVYLEKELHGALRAVKEIRKPTHGARTMDYLRELLAMAYFSMV